MENVYEQYFNQQAGRGREEVGVGPVYEASFPYQKGRGCCGITGRYISALATPIIAKGLRAVGEEAASAGYGFYRDVTSENPLSLRTIGESAVTRISEAGRNLKGRAKKALTGRGNAKKRKPAKSPTKKGLNTTKTRKAPQTKRRAAPVRKQTIPTPRDVFS